MGNLEQAMRENEEKKAKGLSVNIRFTDMDLFQDTVSLIRDVCKDKRFDREIREEYKEKLFGIISEDEYVPAKKE